MKFPSGNLTSTAVASAALFLTGAAFGELQSPFSEKAEFARYAERLRESVLLSLEPEVRIPTTSGAKAEAIPSRVSPPPAPVSGGM